MTIDLLDWLWRSLLASSIAIVVVLALRPVWLRWIGAGSVLWLWLLLPVAMLASSLPAPELRLPSAAALPGEYLTEAVQPRTAPVAHWIAVPAVAENRDGAALAPNGSLPMLLLLLWLAGVALAAFSLAWRQRAFVRRLGRLQARGDGILIASAADIGPLVTGVLRPRIVLPSDFEQRFDPLQQRLILAHERCHLRRGDLIVNLLFSVLRCLHWFNPLLHVCAARLQLDQELACDAAVLRAHPSARRAYADAMLNTELASLGSPLGCLWQSNHPLKRRILMLQRPISSLPRRIAGAGLAGVLSFGVGVSAWAAQPPRVVPAVVPQPVQITALERTMPTLPANAIDVQPAIAGNAPLAIAAAVSGPLAGTSSTGPVPLDRTAFAIDAAPPRPAASVASAAADTARADYVNFEPPRLRHGRAPRPPQRSLRMDLDGELILRLRVGADGRVLAADVERSEVDERAAQWAARNVRRWKFEPARLDGKPVESVLVVPVDFRRPGVDLLDDRTMYHLDQRWIDQRSVFASTSPGH
jgi:bla regulator protein blaR1